MKDRMRTNQPELIKSFNEIRPPHDPKRGRGVSEGDVDALYNKNSKDTFISGKYSDFKNQPRGINSELWHRFLIKRKKNGTYRQYGLNVRVIHSPWGTIEII